MGKLGSDVVDRQGSGNAFCRALGDKVRSTTVELWDVPRTATALGWFEDFLVASERCPFIPALGVEAQSGALYNRETLDLFGSYIRQAAPKAQTKHGRVSADSIAGYVSAVYTLRCREAGYDVAPVLACASSGKVWRREEGPDGDRRVARGFRAFHFRRLDARYPVRSAEDAVERAAGLVAHNLMLRGGEIGTPDTPVVTHGPAHMITWLSIEWKPPCVESGGRPWCFVFVVPIKDTRARARAHPIPLSRAHDGPFGSCAVCPYDAMVRAWWMRRAPQGGILPLDERGWPADGWWKAEARSSAPPLDGAFFSHTGGRPFRTGYVLNVVRRWATIIDEPADSFEARAFRIAGATDFRELLGDDVVSSRTIKDRGRLCSEIAVIYKRPLLHVQLRASASVGTARHAGLEDVLPGFTQPAYR